MTDTERADDFADRMQREPEEPEPAPLPLIPMSYGRPIAEIERDLEIEGTIPLCPHCGDFAEEGLITCGSVGCREHDQAPNPTPTPEAESKAARDAVLIGGGS